MEIEVKTNDLQRCARKERDVSNALRRINGEISNCKRRLNSCMSSSSSPAIQRTLERVHNIIEVSVIGDVSSMSDILECIVKEYNRTESELSGSKPSEDKIEGTGSNGGFETNKEIYKVILDFLTKFGFSGDMTSVFMAALKILLDGDGFSGEDLANLLEGGNSTVDAIKDMWEALNDSKFSVADFFKKALGFNKYFEGSQATTWGQKFTGGLKQGISKATSAASWIFSGLANAFSNYEEYKSGEIGTGRAVAETVSETIIDVLKGAIISGIVGGIAATVGAPVVLVGLVGVGISVVADMICKKYTGKGVTEALSDAILDKTAENLQRHTGARTKYRNGTVPIYDTDPKIDWLMRGYAY